jgi:hypothetical protein
VVLLQVHSLSLVLGKYSQGQGNHNLVLGKHTQVLHNFSRHILQVYKTLSNKLHKLRLKMLLSKQGELQGQQ